MPSPEPSVSPPQQLAPPTPRGRDHPIEIQTRLELVRLAYRELLSGTIASSLAAAALGIAVASRFDSTHVRWWLAGMMAVTVYRTALAMMFRRQTHTVDETARWGLWYVVGTTTSAAGWGASVWLFPTLELGTTLGFAHVLLLAGLCSGSSRLLLPMKKGSIAYLLVVMLPLAAWFFAQGDLTGAAMGVCVLVYLGFMCSAALHNHQVLSIALSTRFEREQLAAELTAENTRRETREAELQEARERAESASRAKGEFLATISHEIRTPMNGVLGMLRIVRDTNLTQEQRSYLKTASDSAEALLLLLNDVLDFSKIEAGRLELEHAPFPPAATARAVSDLLHARARDKNLQFELQLAETLPGVVMGDATRVRQILVNLIGNAIKFTERGRVELSVTCAEKSAGKATLHFTVTDTGIGIDSAAMERLFTPFTQADNSMSRRYGGTGLGLAISMRLAKAMGGTVQVQSTLNQGSTFRLILPCKLVETPTAAVRPAETPRFVTPKLSGRVLVVEDDTVNQQVIELFLKKMSITPKFAADGEAGIAAATSEPFDLILMDCQLPGIDGMETTRRIRAQLPNQPLRIIALTANASTHVREACLASGMDDFLSKPVRFELLAGVLQRNLRAADGG